MTDKPTKFLFGFPMVESPALNDQPVQEIVLVNPFTYFVYGEINGEPFKMVRSEYERARADHPELNLPEPPPIKDTK